MVKSTISGMILDVPIKEGGQVIESNTFNEGTTICSVAKPITSGFEIIKLLLPIVLIVFITNCMVCFYVIS